MRLVGLRMWIGVVPRRQWIPWVSLEVFVQRRNILNLEACTGVASTIRPSASSPSSAIPVIDAHIHLFDTRRPGGLPWPDKSDTVLYQPALPARYAKIATSSAVVGAIVIEASPLESDNDWVLSVIEKNPIIVGMVGNLVPGSPNFLAELERLRRNPLFLGIRYGNLWNRDLASDINKPGFTSGLKRLAKFGLQLDTANPNRDLILAIRNLSDRIPDLRIVVDHLPSSPIPSAASARKEYWSHLRALSQNPNVYVKLSEIPRRVGGSIPQHASFYRRRLDAIWNIFGEDHILYGSDWPNSDHLLSYTKTFKIVCDYVAPKGRAACEKFFWKNSVAAYKWHPRTSNQPVNDNESSKCQ